MDHDSPTPLNIADELRMRPIVQCNLDETSPCDEIGPGFPIGHWCNICLTRTAAYHLRERPVTDADAPTNAELADRLAADADQNRVGTHSTECWRYHWQCRNLLIAQRLRGEPVERP